MTMRYFIEFQYYGVGYKGFQRQPTIKNTIQETVEVALGKIFLQEIEIFASGRTDVGVHAILQTAHFDIHYRDAIVNHQPHNFVTRVNDNLKNDNQSSNKFHQNNNLDIPNQLIINPTKDINESSTNNIQHSVLNEIVSPQKLILACNHFLPPSIRVLNAQTVDDNFHARYSVKSKTYEYLLYSGIECPLWQNRAHRLSKELDIDKVQLSLQYLLGKKDFSVYMSKGSSVKGTVRTVYDAQVTTHPNEYNPYNSTLYKFQITASGFLYNMVRKITAHLIQIGQSKLPPQSIKTVLESNDRETTKNLVPAYGLYLKKVEY